MQLTRKYLARDGKAPFDEKFADDISFQLGIVVFKRLLRSEGSFFFGHKLDSSTKTTLFGVVTQKKFFFVVAQQ